MSSNRQTTYNSGNPKELIRCTSQLTIVDPTYRVFAAGLCLIAGGLIGVALLGFPAPLLKITLILIALFLLPAFSNFILVMGLLLDPRNCTTTMSDYGVIDHTENSDPVSIPWKKIISIRFNKGDVYFLGWNRSIYIPSFAFASIEEATDFFNDAHLLWQEARDNKVSAKITSYGDVMALETDTITRIQEFDDQEEAMWKEMELKHKQGQREG
ncbi:MAG: hypothetical protein SGJ27_05015 [Candidatus Melainabacteria bacterium]|nr:hypothetical protein [Candidatus Melainabacteria bacterium]